MCPIKACHTEGLAEEDPSATGLVDWAQAQQIQGRFDAISTGNNRFMTGNLLKIG
jgi:hypothetical protein